MIYVCCVLCSICQQGGDNDIRMLCAYTEYVTWKEIMIYVCCVYTHSGN